MTPQQYEKLTELFHSVMKLAPDERLAFLNQISDEDAALRRELESLLSAHEEGALTEKPPEDIAAGLYLAQHEDGAAIATSLAPNTRIGRYQIRSLLGKGGMGEVYLAQDTVLRRLVALKLLPAAAAANEDRMRRFVQEAKAAAALSHPHIAQIFEIGEHNGAHFIVMEFVDGVTLRAKIHSEHTELPKLLKYLQQVGEGLAKAHAAGIVHRDLKPDNIMITRDGYAKILDFGLAKLIEPQTPFGSGSATSSEAGTAIMAQESLSGIVMGTTGYMSPEQAQGKGKEIDHRSDIFSFGCILFEAVTGHRPFAAESVIKSLHKVVYEAAPPITDFNPSAPPDLQRIVRRCLAKDADERYQTIKDVALELKEVRQRMAGPAEVDSTGPSSGSTATSGGRQTTEQSATSTSSVGYLLSQIKRHKRSAAITLAALVIAAGALAYFSYFKHSRAAALTEQDTILIADFVNTTGDADLDGTLKTGLAVQLEQSPFLNLLSDERVREMLLYMERSPDERVTREIAREICKRQGLKAVLAGSVSNLGSHYVIGLDVINAHTGDVIAREQEEAESKEQVLRTLGQAATKLREKLGESLSSIQKFDAPIEQVTTISLEALKACSLAEEASLRGNYQESIKHANRAIEFDPNFMRAYQTQAQNYINLGQSELGIRFGTKAFELRDRVSERERLLISFGYYWSITGELDKATEAMESLKQTYPREAHNNLGVQYTISGQYEKAIEEFREAIKDYPNAAISYSNLAVAFIRLNQFAEAKEILNQALARKLDIPEYHRSLYVIAFINGDSAEMEKHIDWASGRPGEFAHLNWQSWTAAFAGQGRQARTFSSRAFDAEGRNAKEDAANSATTQALTDAVLGNCERVKEDTAKGIALAHQAPPFWNAALALAACGEVGRTQALVDEYTKRFPKNTLGKAIWLPTIRATTELRRNNPAQAIDLFEGTKQYEAAAKFWPYYTRGQAYLKLGKGSEAVAEFQKILDHWGWDPLSPLYPLAHLGLARAAVLNLDNSGARQAYQDFFALWKDADADLPMMIEAKKEYEKLK